MSEYCLRWNNHRPNLVTVFSELLTSEALVDVTLATDGHYIHAHKLVLSACSVYFKDLFGANPCKHPIVILKDIRIDDLKTVIDFIYRGEVNVAQERLQDVLKTAESLRIKGLAENPRNYDEISTHSTRLSSSSFGPQVTRQRSSLTDSREQSLSVEGEEDGEPGTPPSSKRRKITSSHDSSESQHGENHVKKLISVEDDQENEHANRIESLVKDEPSDDRENDKSYSGEVEQESNVNRVADAMLMLQGASQDSAEDSVNPAGTSSEPSQSSPHSQGSMCRWGSGEPPSLESLLAGPYTPLGPPTPAVSPPLLPSSPPPPAVPISSQMPMCPSIPQSSSSSMVSYPMLPPPPPPPPAGPSSFHVPKGWSSQFRRMSPNMLMAIDAVRSGKMGFTQAGKTYGVNGRTLWVYYRKLGYEVHNTFRGKKKAFDTSSQNINFMSNVDYTGASSSRDEGSPQDAINIPVVTVLEEEDDIIPDDQLVNNIPFSDRNKLSVQIPQSETNEAIRNPFSDGNEELQPMHFPPSSQNEFQPVYIPMNSGSAAPICIPPNSEDKALPITPKYENQTLPITSSSSSIEPHPLPGFIPSNECNESPPPVPIPLIECKQSPPVHNIDDDEEEASLNSNLAHQQLPTATSTSALPQNIAQGEVPPTDEASRTLQTLLDSINLKNVWTTSV